jgi:hypothetical protein
MLAAQQRAVCITGQHTGGQPEELQELGAHRSMDKVHFAGPRPVGWGTRIDQEFLTSSLTSFLVFLLASFLAWICGRSTIGWLVRWSTIVLA